MDSIALSQSQEKAAAGDVAAQMALARHHEAEGRYDEARHWPLGLRRQFTELPI